MGKRVLVCGSRRFDDRELMEREFDTFPPDAVIIEGEQVGADLMARAIAEERGMAVLPFPAEWNRYGNAAGPIRNQQMLDEGHPDCVSAFPLPGCKGTWNMVNKAKKAGVEVHVVERGKQ
jgi:hypothetical protein